MRRRQAQRLARLGGQAAADDQRNAAAGAHFVEQHVGLHGELGDDFAVLQRAAFVRTQFDHVAHVHLRHVELDRQRAGVFHRVVEDRGDLVAQADAAEALVRNERDVFAGEPQHRVGRRLARGAGADHVADVGDQVALGFQRLDWLIGPILPGSSGLMPGRAFLSIASACIGMSGRVVASGAGDRSSVLVSPVHLEHGQGQALRHFGTRGEPLGVRPGLQHGLGVGAALVGQVLDVVEVVEHQQGLLQALGGDRADRRVVQQVDHGLDVEAAQHGAQQPGRQFARHQRAGLGALGDLLRKALLTRAASSTPAGTRLVIRSTRNSSSPAGGFFRSATRSTVCGADSGSGGMPRDARSATWER